jgi:PPE-repeat protein
MHDAAVAASSPFNNGTGNIGFGNDGDNNLGVANAGDGNTGIANTGEDNAGVYNTGDSNTGVDNAGDANTGVGNTGYDNAGVSNTGVSNAGVSNSGVSNAGVANYGSDNSGVGNTGDGNAGVSNSGVSNVGVSNTGVSNTGFANTGTDNTGAFDSGNDNNGYLDTGSGNTGNLDYGDNNSGNVDIGSGNSGSVDIGSGSTDSYNAISGPADDLLHSGEQALFGTTNVDLTPHMLGAGVGVAGEIGDGNTGAGGSASGDILYSTDQSTWGQLDPNAPGGIVVTGGAGGFASTGASSVGYPDQQDPSVEGVSAGWAPHLTLSNAQKASDVQGPFTQYALTVGPFTGAFSVGQSSDGRGIYTLTAGGLPDGGGLSYSKYNTNTFLAQPIP